MKKILFVFSLFLVFTVVFSPTLFAEEQEASSSPKLPRLIKEKIEVKREISDIRKTTKSDELLEKKEAAKEKVCEVHAKVINKRASMLTEKAEKMQARFSKIGEAVEKYYTEKLVPDGKSLSNYDELAQDIDNKKAALKPLIEAVNKNVEEYDCKSDDPKSEFEGYRKDMQLVIKGLGEYRKSIKNLIVAVRGLKGEVEESPTPTP